jgi:triosephosphate isomerase
MTNNNIYFIANWKMYGDLKSINSIENVINLSKKIKYKKAKIIYCPPYTLLVQFVKKTNKTKINIGAQNCHTHQYYGAFTGSINAKMIKNTGTKFVIIGHSENRINGDTNKIINQKIRSSLKEKLKVIFCIGESLKEKKNKKTNLVLNQQIKNGLKNIKKLNKIIFAYEPVWSIGTGIIPKFNDLENQVKEIKIFIKKTYKVKNPIVLYGGSVNPKNISSLKEITSINGFLIGGASQNSKKFIDIIKKTIN